MTKATINLAEPCRHNIGPMADRKPQRDLDLKLPPGTTVVSVDTHWEVNEDVFYKHFPAHLKDKAPRVWFDDYWHIGYKGEVEAFPIDQRKSSALTRSVGDGIADFNKRYEHFDAECVELDICFPHTLFAFVRYPDAEVQENMYRVYNEYVAKALQEKSGGRTFSVGILANWWDPAAVERSMRQIVDLGLKTFMIPLTLTPGSSYSDPEFDRLWAVAAEAGLPVCLHVSEGLDLRHRGGRGASLMALFSPFRKHFGQLVFGGVFDRNPKLKIVFVEGSISWVPPALQDAEMLYDSFGDTLDHMEHRPSYYWHNNCYGAFQHDRLGLQQIDIIGADRIMWASDYPHSESTFGYGRTAIQAVVDAVASPDDVRAILGGTAIDVFKLKS